MQVRVLIYVKIKDEYQKIRLTYNSENRDQDEIPCIVHSLKNIKKQGKDNKVRMSALSFTDTTIN